MRASWVLPYGLLIALAGSLGPALWGPAVALGVGIFAVHERWLRGGWRHVAGWGLTLALLVPAVELVARGRAPLVGLFVVPAIGLAILHRGTGGRVGEWWRRRPLAGGALYLALTAILLVPLRSWLAFSPPSDDLLASLAPEPAVVELDAAQMEAAVGAVEAALSAWASVPDPGSAAAETCAERVPPLVIAWYCGAHVTLWIVEERMLRGRSATGEPAADLCHATALALRESREPERWAEGADRVRIQVDLPGPPVPLPWRPGREVARPLLRLLAGEEDRASGVRGRLRQLVYDVEPGVDGLELHVAGERGVVLPADPVLRGWFTPRVWGRAEKVERLLTHAARDIGRRPSVWREPGATLIRFRCTSFGRPVPGEGARRLARGHVRQGEPDSDELLDGARAAADWLVGASRPDGAFDYEVFPHTRASSDEYNAVRHAGCALGLYRMAELARQVEGAGVAGEFLEAGRRAEGWGLSRLQVPLGADDRQMRAVVYGHRGATAGAAAFAILAILERPAAGHDLDAERLEGLGRFLLSMVDPDGRVFETWDDARASERVTGVEHPYFPGLVVLSLAELYGATGDERWLAGAQRVVETQLRWYAEERPTPGHWTMQGLWELYRLTGDEAYARANLRMGDHFAGEQFPPHEPLFPDYRGAFRRGDDVPRTIRAASRCEALGAVVDSARALGEDPTPYEDALLAASRHLLENQFRAENSYYLPQRHRLVGAVRLGLLDNHCRIDGNKHAMLGLVQAWRVAMRRQGRTELERWPLSPGSAGPGGGVRDVQDDS